MIRSATPQELNATLLIRIPIEEAVAKVRTGEPHDKEGDYGLGIWAGVINLRTHPESVEVCPRLEPNVTKPEHVAQYMAQQSLFD
jgi:hypothetical protein